MKRVNKHRPGPAPTPVDVAVAALWRAVDDETEVLVTRRPRDVHLGGRWELPGGKVRHGESIEQTLRRELREEIDVTPTRLEPLIVVEHCYPERVVRLHAMLGEVDPAVAVRHLGVTAHQWVPVGTLDELDLPEANAPISAALRDTLQK